MTRQPYRLVIDINEGTFWVEQYRAVKPRSDETKDQNKDEAEKEKSGKEFAKVTGYLNKPGKLPAGVHLAKFIDAKNETSVTSGQVHLYFYPVGETSGGTLILETSEDTAMTLIINPITGLVTSYRGVIEDSRDVT